MDEKIKEMEIDIIKTFSVEYIYALNETMKKNSDIKILASSLIAKGYRKESDTAREILAEAKKWVMAHYKDKITDSFGERPMLFIEAFGCLFEYLKEKYGVEVE